MWFLRSVKQKEITHFLLVGEEYIVGRKDATIMIGDDPSISRKHAILTVSHPESNLNNTKNLSILTIKDIGSKYGTYINKEKQIGPEGIILKIGDQITFGQCESSYDVCYQPLIVSTSCIESQEKRILKELILKLGGHILSEWQENCTHLVMKEIKVTIKAVCAMISLKHMVTIKYFQDLIKAIQEQKCHPDPENYIPESGEPLLMRENVSFKHRPERTHLFKNKTFICTSQKQYKKLHLAITLASGTVTLLGENDELKASVFLHPDTIIMKHQSDSGHISSSNVLSYVNTIEQELKRNKKRVIPESDIGLAVVHCSIERYCNPSYNLESTLFSMSNLHSQTLTQGDVYAEETQTSSVNSTGTKKKYGSFVEESLEKNLKNSFENLCENSSTSKKRPREETKVESPSKHMKLSNKTDELSSNNVNFHENSSSLKCMNTLNKMEYQSTPSMPESSVQLISKNELIKNIKVENPTTSSNNNPVYTPSVEENDSMKSNLTIPWTEILDIPDGFLSKSKRDNLTDTKANTSNIDEELPSKLVKVEYAALCPLRNIHPEWVIPVDHVESNKPVKNFKKFRKVLSTANRLPHIIGGRDLVAYNSNSSKAFEDWLNENPDTQPEDTEEGGIFDWDPKPASLPSRRRW